MVAAPIFETEVGAEYEKMPPHVTIFPWFALPETDWSRFDARMHDIVEETAQPTIMGGAPAFFSARDGRVGVRLPDRPTSTFNIMQGFDIHAGVHGVVRRYGDDFDPNYVGIHWKPHVTDKADFALAEGQAVTLPELVVYKREQLGPHFVKTVKAIYRWGDTSHEQ